MAYRVYVDRGDGRWSRLSHAATSCEGKGYRFPQFRASGRRAIEVEYDPLLSGEAAIISLMGTFHQFCHEGVSDWGNSLAETNMAIAAIVGGDPDVIDIGAEHIRRSARRGWNPGARELAHVIRDIWPDLAPST